MILVAWGTFWWGMVVGLVFAIIVGLADNRVSR